MIEAQETAMLLRIFDTMKNCLDMNDGIFSQALIVCLNLKLWENIPNPINRMLFMLQVMERMKRGETALQICDQFTASIHRDQPMS